MTDKSKLGRNPFATKKTQQKNGAKTHSSYSRGSHSFFSIEHFAPMTQTVRWIFFDAPIGVCFLACQACLKSFRVKGRS